MFNDQLDQLPTAARFSRRVENYARYRPGYPEALLDLLAMETGWTPAAAVADIGSGTGILSEMFLHRGNVVYGVEPNSEMRAMAEKLLRSYPNFKSIAGVAENTGLPARSVDFVTAGQAFHWFDRDRAKAEFARILRPAGWIVIVWNHRRRERTPFLRAYDALLRRFGTDYEKVAAENIDEEGLRRFFDAEYRVATFENFQTLNAEELKGRFLSASYVPLEGDPRFAEMMVELERIFSEHETGGTVTLEYDTKVYYGRIRN